MPEPRSLLSLRARGEKEGKVRGELEGCRIGGTGRAGFTLVNYPRERSDGEREREGGERREKALSPRARAARVWHYTPALLSNRALHTVHPLPLAREASFKYLSRSLPLSRPLSVVPITPLEKKKIQEGGKRALHPRTHTHTHFSSTPECIECRYIYVCFLADLFLLIKRAMQFRESRAFKTG